MKRDMNIMRLSKVLPPSKGTETSGDVTDSVGYWRREDGDAHIQAVLQAAHRCYDNWEYIRTQFMRNKNFTYSGHQWDDLITICDETMTEAEYLMKQGCIPLENNLIRRLLRNIVGVFRNQNKEVVCKARDREEQGYADGLSELLKYDLQLNNRTLKDARQLEQSLIGGFACYKHTAGWRDHKFDCWTDIVNINDFATDNGMTDPMGADVSMIVQLHAVTLQKLCVLFAHSKDDVERLKQEYRTYNDPNKMQNLYRRFGDTDPEKEHDFFMPRDPDMCRVIEVWSLESRNRYHCWDKGTGMLFDIDEKDYDELVTKENSLRLQAASEAGMPVEDVALVECDKKEDWFIDEYWYYRFLTPWGHVLSEGETPYAHGSHPYTIFLFPFINGEVHSLVEDVRPLQKYVNRLVTMQDWVTRASAKGVLLYPEGAFDGQDMHEVAKAWSQPNSVLSFKYKPGTVMPQQVTGSTGELGLTEQLRTQLQLFEDISGVNGALQGKPGYSTTSGTLYAQQTQNSTTSLVDMLDSFSTFLCISGDKIVKNILQYYDDERITEILGKYGLGEKGDADSVRNLNYDCALTEATNGPTYRAISNDYLIQFWQAGQITMQQLLENGDFPFADRLLQTLNAEQLAARRMIETQTGQPLPDMQQAQAPQPNTQG